MLFGSCKGWLSCWGSIWGFHEWGGRCNAVVTGQRGPCVWEIIDVLKQFRGSNGFKKWSCHKTNISICPLSKTPSFRVNFKVLKRCEEKFFPLAPETFVKVFPTKTRITITLFQIKTGFQEAVNHQQISFQMLWTVIAIMKNLMKWLYKSHEWLF